MLFLIHLAIMFVCFKTALNFHCMFLKETDLANANQKSYKLRFIHTLLYCEELDAKCTYCELEPWFIYGTGKGPF